MKPTNEIYPCVWNAMKRYYVTWTDKSLLKMLDDKIPVSFLDAMENALNDNRSR